jgi:uncharacterized metal-binding protein YceD (DUF177 family)
MKIALRKVGKTPIDFDVQSNKVAFKGFLQYHSGKLILLQAKLTGTIDIACNLCAQEFPLEVDEDIEFFISDGIHQSDAEMELDVVEFLDATADVDELLHSEIELIKSDYHTCEKCQDSEFDLES